MKYEFAWMSNYYKKYFHIYDNGAVLLLMLKILLHNRNNMLNNHLEPINFFLFLDY